MKCDNTREPDSAGVPGQGKAIGADYHTHETRKSHILVPLDGSDLAEKALPHAIALSRATSGAITLLRVVPPITVMTPVFGAVGPSLEYWEDWAAEPQVARDYLQALADKLRDTELVVQTTVLEGNPASEIVSYAEKHSEVSRIVMSSHGRSGLGRWVMGSVAEKVLQASPVPLLVVRAGSEETVEAAPTVPEYRTILVPLDGSELAETALGEAQILAEKVGARVVLVSVASTPLDLVLARTGGSEKWSPTPWSEEALELKGKLDAILKRLEGEHLVVEARLTYGDPADEILKLSNELEADIIVMATHGRGGLERLLIGSVANRLVKASRVPVLLVRVKAGGVPRVQKPQVEQAQELATPL